MTEHLPECPSESIVCEGEYCYCDYVHFCYCDALRACEKRVLEGRPDLGISEKQAYDNHAIYQNGYEQGSSDAAAAAVQRVKALAVNPYYCEDQWYGAETHLVTSQVITAVKGDQS